VQEYRSLRRQGEKVKSRAGFSLTELVVVLAIMLVVSGLSVPSVSRTIDKARLNTAAQQVASIYQEARIRATQDDNYYAVPVTPVGVRPAQVCVDLDGNNACSTTEPQAQLPDQVTLSNAGIPVPLNAATMGFTLAPTTTENSVNYGPQGTLEPGLAWNSRGVPCQRGSATSPCSGPIAWVQYLQFRRSAGDILYAAVTVSPSGNIRIWHYAGGNAGSSWF
jgi:prepilin-type N-terminal cleavage/methylation domain-containing protein